MLNSNRLYNLDYLRGLAAFSIMIYHYSAWGIHHFLADTLLGRIGIYGVSIFYVLSGLTLYYVYFKTIKICRNDIYIFFKKRIFRIFPLLWLTTIIAILLSRKVPDFSDLFLNLTGLFGFISWETYFSAGVWSIGNELVFYVFFPFFIFFLRKSKYLIIILSLIIFCFYLYFAFVKLDSDLTLVSQWRDYINPLNQVFLFLGGFLIGHLARSVNVKSRHVIFLLCISTLIFVFYPVQGDKIHLVTGVNRLVFTFCCFLICFCFYKLQFKLPDTLHKNLIFLGEASYSVYLLHPIVWNVIGVPYTLFNDHVFKISIFSRIFMSVVITLIISYLTYQFFEKYFVRLAKNNFVTKLTK